MIFQLPTEASSEGGGAGRHLHIQDDQRELVRFSLNSLTIVQGTYWRESIPFREDGPPRFVDVGFKPEEVIRLCKLATALFLQEATLLRLDKLVFSHY